MVWIAAGVVLCVTPLRAWAQFGGPALVGVSPVRAQELAAGQEYVGTVVPIRTAIVGSAVDGRVIEFPVNEGDRVETGQTLAKLLTQTIELELQASQAELRLRQSELEELLNGSRPDEIRQAKSRMEAARAQQEYLVARRKRTEALFRQRRTVSQENLQEAVSASLRADELFNEAEAAYNLTKEGPRPERIAAARAQVEIQAAKVEQLQDRISKHTIVARFPGYITAEHTEVGQWVQQGEAVAEIIALDEVDVEVHVMENQIRHVQVGATARIEIPALDQPTWTGQVVLVVPQADVRSRTFRVKVRLKNSIQDDQALLKAGMLARVTISTGRPQRALLVPKDAIVLGSDRPFLWVIPADRVQTEANPQTGVPMHQAAVQRVVVRPGIAVDDQIQVIDDVELGDYELQPNDLVVTRGNERIMPPLPNKPSLVTWPVPADEPPTR